MSTDLLAHSIEFIDTLATVIWNVAKLLFACLGLYLSVRLIKFAWTYRR